MSEKATSNKVPFVLKNKKKKKRRERGRGGEENLANCAAIFHGSRRMQRLRKSYVEIHSKLRMAVVISRDRIR